MPNMIMLMAIGPLVTMGTPRTNLGPPGTIVVLASMGIRVGGRNNYLRFQRGDQGPDREGGRAGGGVAPGQTPYYHTILPIYLKSWFVFTCSPERKLMI